MHRLVAGGDCGRRHGRRRSSLGGGRETVTTTRGRRPRTSAPATRPLRSTDWRQKVLMYWFALGVCGDFDAWDRASWMS